MSDVIILDKKDFKRLEDKVDRITDLVSQIAGVEDMDATDIWLDSGEVCEILKMSRRTLQRLRAKEVIGYTVFGGKCLYQLSEIQRILKQNSVTIDSNVFDKIKRNYTLSKQAEKVGFKTSAHNKK